MNLSWRNGTAFLDARPAAVAVFGSRQAQDRNLEREAIRARREPKRKIYRKAGGNTMVRVMAENRVAIADPAKGTTKMGTIMSVVENESDPNYVRRNILVKGAIIETDKGRVRITSRPGKDGVINGVLVE